MRKRAGMIIYNKLNQTLVLIKRVKMDTIYWVLPGGGVEKNENFAEAAIREMAEELNINQLTQEDIIEVIHNIVGESEHRYFLYTTTINFELKLVGEEKKRSTELNQYELHWVPIVEVAKLDIKPDSIKNELINILEQLLDISDEVN